MLFYSSQRANSAINVPIPLPVAPSMKAAPTAAAAAVKPLKPEVHVQTADDKVNNGDERRNAPSKDKLLTAAAPAKEVKADLLRSSAHDRVQSETVRKVINDEADPAHTRSRSSSVVSVSGWDDSGSDEDDLPLPFYDPRRKGLIPYVLSRSFYFHFHFKLFVKCGDLFVIFMSVDAGAQVQVL